MIVQRRSAPSCGSTVENIPLQAERHSGRTAKTVRLSTGISVRLQTGMLFGITTEWCSASDRNRVHLRPDSPNTSKAAILVMRREEHPDKQWQLPRPRRRIIRSNGRHITPPRQAKRINFNSYYLIFAEAFLNLLNLKSRKLDGLLYRYLMLFSASLSRFIPQLADGVS